MARKKKHVFSTEAVIVGVLCILLGVSFRVGLAFFLKAFSPATLVADILTCVMFILLNYCGSYIVIDSENKIIKRKGLFWGYRKTLQFSDIQEIKFYKLPASRYGKDCIVLLDAESDESWWFTKYAPIRLEWTTKTVDFLKNEAEEIYERVLTDTTIPEPED